MTTKQPAPRAAAADHEPAAALTRDERVDRLTEAVENVCDVASIEVVVHETGPLTGVSPLRRLVRAMEGAGLMNDTAVEPRPVPDPVILASHADHPLAAQVQAVLDEEGVDGVAEAIRRVAWRQGT